MHGFETAGSESRRLYAGAAQTSVRTHGTRNMTAVASAEAAKTASAAAAVPLFPPSLKSTKMKNGWIR